MERRSISNAFSVSTIQDGVSPAVIEVSLATLLYDADANGASTSAQEFAVTYTMKVGNETILEQNVTSVTIQTPNGVSIKQNTKTNSGCTFVIEKDASPSGVIGITMTTTKNGNLYEPHTAITVAANVRGENGERGKVGRFYYYSGFDWDANNDTDVFAVTDAQVPFFSKAGSSSNKYYVFNPETTPSSGEMTMAQMAAATTSSGDINWNNKPWEPMWDDFKYLITEAIFADFAHLGSAIISGDWKLSQYGKIYDTNGDEHTIDSTNTWNSGTHTYTKDDAYTLFDSDYPNSSKPSANNFVPNYAEDWLSGATYQQEAYVAGSIYASSIGTKFQDVDFSSSAVEYYVNWDKDTGHLKNETIWNYRCRPKNKSAKLSVFLPNNKFSYFGQRVVIYNTGYGLGSGQEITIYSATVNVGELDTFRPLVGITLPKQSNAQSQSQLINDFTPVKSISFVNGIVELICVPPVEDETGILCDWAVVNIGTNYYLLEGYTQ